MKSLRLRYSAPAESESSEPEAEERERRRFGHGDLIQVQSPAKHVVAIEVVTPEGEAEGISRQDVGEDVVARIVESR